MRRLVIEVETQLYAQLSRAAQDNGLSIEQECLRRLQGLDRHSHYLQALLADLRAEEEQRRASARDQVA
jgi:hypothetical protein